MLVLSITKRFLTELVRLRIAFAIFIAMPVFMTFMFWFAFNTAGLGTAQTFILGVINDDEGVGEELAEYMKELNTNPLFNTGLSNDTLDNGFAADFISLLSSINYTTDNQAVETVPIFEVRYFANSSIGQTAIESREIDALIIFPENYSNTTLSAVNQAFYIQNGIFLHNISYGVLFQWEGPPVPTQDNGLISIIGDQGYSRYQIVQIILSQIFTDFNKNLQNFPYSGGEIEINIESVTLQDLSLFDTIFPGILVFSVLTQSGMLAAFLVTEFTETKTVARVRLSLIKPWEYILGATFYQFILSFFQIALIIGISMVAFGFHPAGDIIQGFFVLMLSTIFTTGLGFFLAGIFNSSDTAGQSSGFLTTPLAFMSGAFMEVPTITLIQSVIPTASGIPRDFMLWDLLPPTHAVNALRSIILYEFTLTEVIWDLILLVVPSIFLLFFGMIFYSKRRLQGDL